MPTQLKPAVVYLLCAYALVTLLGIALTVLFAAVLNLPQDPVGTPPYAIAAYRATEPIHPLLNLLVFPFFAWAYLRRLRAGVAGEREAWRLGAFWCGLTIVLDLVGWVLIPHPWKMPAWQFYVLYQPWITLIYLVILLSPVLAQRVGPRHAERQQPGTVVRG
jgi:hypothetical protein